MSSDQPVPAGTPVVIVEDDADTLDLYAMSLEAAGFDVRPARNAGDALDLVRALRPRVVVTDLTLPDLAGVRLCEALSEAGRADLDALIVVSGSADEEVLSGVRAAGAREVLAKPCLPAELEAAIRRALA
jgi:DNA-binding response OmpR family regulator